MTGRSSLGLVVVLALSCKAAEVAQHPSAGREPFEFVGNTIVSTSKLERVVRAEVEAADDEFLTKALIDDAAYAIEVFYLEEGFSSARVSYDLIESDGVPAARFLVSEGVRTELVELRLRGNEAFDRETLLHLLDQRDERYYVRDEIDAAAASIRRFYFDRGYRGVSVAKPSVELRDDGRSAVVEIAIEEGPLYVLREVLVEDGLDELAREHARAGAELLQQPYSPFVGQKIRASLREAYLRRGRPDCRVGIERRTDDDTGDVRLVFTIEPGELVTISSIRVEGNDETKEDVIRRRLLVAAGDVYDSEKIQKSFRRLVGTGIFETVRIELEQDSGPERTLVVHVTEAPSLELYVEPGWGSYEGPRIRMGVADLNVLGTGRRLSLEANASPLDVGASLRLTDPWFLGTDLTATTSIFGNRREEPSFTSTEVGVGVNLRKPWNERLSTTIGYQFRFTRLDDVDLTVPLPELFDDPDVGSLVSNLLYVDRDSVLYPRRGTRLNLQLEWASSVLGSEVDFVKSGIDVSQAYSLRSSTVLAASVRTEAIIPIADTDVIPLQLRLFNGGENTVRSFEESELGPKDVSGEPVGGEARTTLSAELRQDLFGNFSGALFCDFGNVALRYDDYFDFDDFRTAVGFGIRYMLPIGPLRIDLGINPNPRDDEDDYVIHFSVGLPY